MRSQASRQALVLPGRHTTRVPLARPATQRDCRVEVPISSSESARNNSPKPSTVLSNSTLTASGVLSRPLKPVPPVISTTCTAGSAIQRDTSARIR